MRRIEWYINVLFWIVTAYFITSGFSIEFQEIELMDGTEKITTVRNETLIIKILIVIGISCLMFYINLKNIYQLKLAGKKANVLFTYFRHFTIKNN